MSSRLTVPVSKFTRSLSTTPAAARPSHLLNNASKAAAATTGRNPNAIAEETTSSDQRNHSTTTTTPHRPTPLPATHAANKPIPFMQTFHHSAPKPAAPSFTAIDRAILPNLFASPATEPDPYANIRVPLLPDNTSPPAGTWRQLEAPDAPLPRPVILVVAADSAQVLPVAALTEVEGMGVDGVELGFVHLLGQEGAGKGEESFEMGRGMIRDLWKGLVEDVWGSGANSGGGAGGKGPAATA